MTTYAEIIRESLEMISDKVAEALAIPSLSRISLRGSRFTITYPDREGAATFTGKLAEVLRTHAVDELTAKGISATVVQEQNQIEITAPLTENTANYIAAIAEIIYKHGIDEAKIQREKESRGLSSVLKPPGINYNGIITDYLLYQIKRFVPESAILEIPPPIISLNNENTTLTIRFRPALELEHYVPLISAFTRALDDGSSSFDLKTGVTKDDNSEIQLRCNSERTCRKIEHNFPALFARLKEHYRTQLSLDFNKKKGL
jgi:hypothetical protein